MRALVDANVYISFLLNRRRTTPPVIVVDAAFREAFTLLLTEGVISEVVEKTQSKPYLVRRIDRSDTRALVDELRIAAQLIPELPPPLPQVGRDRKDDYLFAHAVAGQADYLVSGDTGVQEIGQIANVHIVSPAGFVQVLRHAGLLPTMPSHNGQ